MQILIAYGTTEGQTRKIANHMGTIAGSSGHTVEVCNCADDMIQIETKDFDAVIVASSVHQERYQPAIYRFVEANLETLRAKPSAFVSVSLSKTFTEGLEEAQRYHDDFANETGWRTDKVHLAEGAIRYSEYDFFKVQTIEHVVLKGKKKMPPKAGNPEFTDWDALDSFTSKFLAHAEMALQEGRVS